MILSFSDILTKDAAQKHLQQRSPGWQWGGEGESGGLDATKMHINSREKRNVLPSTCFDVVM